MIFVKSEDVRTSTLPSPLVPTKGPPTCWSGGPLVHQPRVLLSFGTMKTFLIKTIVSLALIAAPTSFAAATALDISQLKAVPEKNYLVTLELNGKQERLNVKVEGNKAKVINSSDQALKAAEGQFRPHPSQPGVFAVTLQTKQGAMTQIWIFRPDGTAAIRENPDRGEQQSAVPVKGDSVEPTAKQ